MSSPGGKPITESLGPALHVTFDIEQDLEPEGGTHNRMQGRNILRLHRIYYEAFRGGTKGGKGRDFGDLEQNCSQ